MRLEQGRLYQNILAGPADTLKVPNLCEPFPSLVLPQEVECGCGASVSVRAGASHRPLETTSGSNWGTCRPF